MKYEDHMFLTKYFFNKSIELKKKLKLPLQVHECVQFKDLEPKWRNYYEKLGYKIGTDFKLDPETYLPF